MELSGYNLLLYLGGHAPDIPCPKKWKANGWIERYIQNPLLSFMEHRLPLFICVLLVPEYVLAWSIRQFFVARK